MVKKRCINMRKSKKQKEDRYFLLTMVLGALSILSYEIVFFKEYKIFVMIWFLVFLFLELNVSRIICSENELKKSYFSILISSLSILLSYMIIIIFSNQIISYLEIGKYFFLYFTHFSLYVVCYHKFFQKKKIQSNLFFGSVLLSILLFHYFILK